MNFIVKTAADEIASAFDTEIDKLQQDSENVGNVTADITSYLTKAAILLMEAGLFNEADIIRIVAEDPATKGLTSEKCVKNLKERGIVLNLPTDKATDLPKEMKGKTAQLKFEDNQLPESVQKFLELAKEGAKKTNQILNFERINIDESFHVEKSSRGTEIEINTPGGKSKWIYTNDGEWYEENDFNNSNDPLTLDFLPVKEKLVLAVAPHLFDMLLETYDVDILEKRREKEKQEMKGKTAQMNVDYPAEEITKEVVEEVPEEADKPLEMEGVKIFHADHGISQGQLKYIVEQLKKNTKDGFFIQEVKLPAELGSVPCGIYGPVMGDPPVTDAEVTMESRGLDRTWKDRMINKPTRPVDYVQAIGARDGDQFTLYTIYGGPLAPQNPDDPGNRDKEGSQKFWSEHALSSGKESVKDTNEVIDKDIPVEDIVVINKD